MGILHLSKLLYYIGNYGYIAAIYISQLWNAKAKQWIQGRKHWLSALEHFTHTNTQPVIWVHCASLGEFEQARPVIEYIYVHYPHYSIALTFFSPSGYTVQQHYKYAHYISYLPVHTRSNAAKFIHILQPTVVMWVKYEYWSHYLLTLKLLKIPTLLISSIFLAKQPFFQWYGSYWRRMLHAFTHIFVQHNASEKLLKTINYLTVTVAGDTRIDRVLHIAQHNTINKAIQHFIGNSKVLIAGSTWLKDEQVIAQVLKNNSINIKLIIVPHEVNEHTIASLQRTFAQSIRYTQYQYNHNATVLIIDAIGILSSIYKYATITYVGGAFGRGLHNVLEPAVYGKPILFGPRYTKFKEAIDLIAIQAAYSITHEAQLLSIISELLHNQATYQTSCTNAANYVISNSGGTQAIINYMAANRLLTKL